ncbi:MAG TPA: deoxyribonuclease II family protein [Pyrinomonadaceae bacterium]|nr:deoxyribonuclease II family protein [Pyrinomonadaceae bacterium]
MAINAIDENGNPVDWWFMYKVSGESKTSNGGKVLGTEYIYFDAETSANGKAALSQYQVDKAGALPNTLAQIYTAANPSLGWFCYNDENPLTDQVDGDRGHTKGVLAFDLESNTAFWLIHSTPKFSPKGAYGYPETGIKMAQTLLCITLESADVAQLISRQMFVAQQPNVYLASDIPEALQKLPNDGRVKLIQNQAAQGTTPVQCVLPFNSKGGTKFMSIAKNKTWGLDFYNDLVGPTLHENLDVETWEHDPVPPDPDSDKVHTVVDFSGIDLNPLGYDIAWEESDDHAKLAISAKSEAIHYVCVGDINFTLAQRKRGGGTVAFQCEPLWESLSSILRGVMTHPKQTDTAT